MEEMGKTYKRKYQVFVSSTYEDLKEERKEVTQALLENDCIPVGMEMFPASNKKQWDIIKSVIDDSDYYLLIIAGRYGSCGKDDDNHTLSYTEMEFDYALKIGKPIIVFLHSDIDSLPLSKSDKTQIGRQRLKKFAKKASNEREIAYWTNKDNLKSQVILAIQGMIRDYPEFGWVKVNKEIEDYLNGGSKDLMRPIAQICNEIYPKLVDFRECLRKADKKCIDETISELQKYIKIVYYESERLRYIDQNEANVALEIINKWNIFSEYYNAFASAQDRMTNKAQIVAEKAEKTFLELVDMVAKNL